MKLARRVKPKSEIKINVYEIISRAVEEGISRGWNRAHKHTTTPQGLTIRAEIEREVMTALNEIIVWPDTHSDSSP